MLRASGLLHGAYMKPVMKSFGTRAVLVDDNIIIMFSINPSTTTHMSICPSFTLVHMSVLSIFSVLSDYVCDCY